MGKRYENILETIGNTPVVRLKKLEPNGVELYGKVESFNPMGSVKDRLALGVIEDAERSGALSPGQTVIEATSGNTGIGLAMVCARKGYPLVVTMAENFSVERRKIMRFLGARVVLTPAAEKGSGMLAKAVELAEHHGWFLARQFENEANAEMHSRTTAVEILEAFEGERLDYWVTGFGTGGTLKGVARVLKQERPETKIVVCEPDNSPVLGSGIPQQMKADGTYDGSHPSFRPHPVQGWAPDFIPMLTQEALELKLVDSVVPVNGAESMELCQELARREGIFAGISSAATLAGALQVAKSAPQGSTVLCMLPDTGERYLSTPLFEDIAVEMTEEEQQISRSTPNFRFDEPSPAMPVAAADAPQGSAAAAGEFIDAALKDPEQPVVMFALEWCEFCWSVRKMFARSKIAYRSVDLDSVQHQKDDLGGRIRAALAEKTGQDTIPQIFVGGEFIGGCNEVFGAYKEGRLQKMLKDKGVAYDESVQLDPDKLLPSWLHSR
jgi:cysteine synthase A